MYLPHENAVKQDVPLQQLESDTDGDGSWSWPELLYPKSSSIISEANLSSSLIQLSALDSSGCNEDVVELQQLDPNSTFLNQFAWSEVCLPVCFCQIPRFDCSASRHKHVRDCSILLSLMLLASSCCCWCCCTWFWSWASCWDAKYQRCSFALRVAESFWNLGLCGAFGSNGKFVRARIPHMSRAASS